MLRPQPAAYPAGQVALYPLSYRRMERRAGFEPATSRLADEVTDIFTTDREGVGGERAMLSLPPREHSATALLPAGFEPASPAAKAAGASTEVTDIFTTAGPVLRTGLDRTDAMHRP